MNYTSVQYGRPTAENEACFNPGMRGGESILKELLPEAVLEHWFLSYVDLLQRLQLFTKANEVGILVTINDISGAYISPAKH